jgi:hypothetical protein
MIPPSLIRPEPVVPDTFLQDISNTPYQSLPPIIGRRF